MKAWRLLAAFLAGWFVFYGCTVHPSVSQICSLELDASLAEGVLLLLTEDSSGKSLWQTLDLATGRVGSYNGLNDPGESLMPPTRVEDVAISPDGKKIAYSTYWEEMAYIISSQDGVITRYAPVENFSRLYMPETQQWFIEEGNARLLNPIAYPLVPTGKEEEMPHRVIHAEPRRLAKQWEAKLGVRAIPTLAIVSSDGSRLAYFPNRLNEWQGFEGWLNDHELHLINFAGANFLDPYTDMPVSDQTILLNWLTGEKLVSGDNFRDQDPLGWPPVYSPSLRYLAYRGIENKVVVFDRIENKIVWQVPMQSPISEAPIWVDDAHLVIMMRDERLGTSIWFLLDRESGAQPIASLDGVVVSYQPSYDRRWIAFWLLNAQSSKQVPENQQLLFLDTKRSRIYDSCFGFEAGEETIGGEWLPARNRFTLSVQHPGETEIIIVDIFRRKRWRILVPFKTTVVGGITLP